MCDMTPCVTYVGVGAREGRDLIAVSGRAGPATTIHPAHETPPSKSLAPIPMSGF